MLLRLAAQPTDWVRLAAALEAVDSFVLANVVRTLLAAAASPTATEAVALAFTPEQAGALQRIGAAIGLSLPATPVAAEPDRAKWVTSAAERAAAVAVADAIIGAHQRRHAA